jgi:hypothetical protein
MTLKYKQAVLIQNLIDGTSTPVGQPPQSTVSARTEMLIPKQTRITLTGTVVTVEHASAAEDLLLVTLQNRNLMMLGFNMRLTIVKGNAVDGIVAATPINIGLSTTAGGDDLMNSVQDTTVATSFVFDQHSVDGTRTYPMKAVPLTDLYLALATDGTPTVDDTLTLTGTIDFFYFDLSKPGL